MNRTIAMCVIVGFAGWLALGSTATAQSGGSATYQIGRDPLTRDSGRAIRPGPRAGVAITAADRAFLIAATMGCLTQLRIDEVAGRRGASLGVKDLAQRLLSEDDKFCGQITDLAARNGVRVPTTLDAEHAAVIKRLAARPSLGFDRAFARFEVDRLQNAVMLFEREAAAQGSDTQVVRFAYLKLHVVRRHLAMAQALATNHTF